MSTMAKRWLPLLILAAGVAGFLLLRLTRPEPPDAEPAERSWRVGVQTLTLARHTPVLPLYGEVVAPDQLTVVASLAGRVAERPVREGDTVAAGALLVAVSEEDVTPLLHQAEAQVADLEAQIAAESVRHRSDLRALESEQAILANARRQFQRLESLLARNLASRESLEAATDALARAELTVRTRQRAIDEYPARMASLEARLAQARANWATVRRDADRARVLAPFAGVVTDIRVAPGDQVARNAPLLTLYPEDGLELRALVPEGYRPELEQALAAGAELRAEATEGGYRFRLVRFSGQASPAGTEAILRLMPGTGRPRPGALLPILLQRPARADTVAVPFSALYGADRVYLVDDQQRLRRVAVERVGEIRRPDGSPWLLIAGPSLASGQRLVVTHLPNAVTGLKVDAVEPEPGS
tara:strand:+ start:716 stop:1960 length:1245 start_codon:yes stop_codon:yes gene_type:complete